MSHLRDVRAKFLPDLRQKWQKTDYFQEFHCSLSVLKVIKLIIIEFLFFLIEMLCKKFLIWALWGQNRGSGWVKNGKKDFHTSHCTTNPAFPKNKVLNSYSLLTH